MRPYSKRTATLLTAGLALGMSHSVNAVTITGANQTVNSLGTYISDWLTELRNEGGSQSQDEAALENLCQNYVNEADNANEGSAEDRANAIRLFEQVAHEEVGAIGSGFTDTGQDLMSNVQGRMQSIRGGTAMLASNSFLLGQTGGAAGDDFSRLSAYTNFSFGDGDKDTTRNERGFDFDSRALTFGADYQVKDGLVAGAALGLGDSEVDMEGANASSEGETISITFYASAYQDDWYIDASLGYALHDYDNTRRIVDIGMGVDDTVTSSTDGDSLSLSVGAGIMQQYGEWSADYALRLNSVSATIDGYSESGSVLALTVGEQEVDSLQAILAAQFSKAYSTESGVFVPTLGVEVHQEFDDETRTVTAQYALDRFNNQFSFTSDDADSTFFLLSAGSSWVMSQGRQLFLNWDHLAGLDDVSSNTLTAGFRMEF